MSTKPRTIDNLGVDISIQYAKNMEYLDTKIIEESKTIPFQTEVFVTSYVPSEWEELFGVRKRHLPWGNFFSPPSFRSHRRNLFSFQLIPSIGTPERHIKEIEKLKDFAFEEKRKIKKVNDKEEQEEKDERDRILKLIEQILFLDKQILFVNSRRTQYQKG